MRDYIEFFRQFRTRFQTTGAITPSSRFLARAMTGPLCRERPQRPVRVLEVGPGTGAVTRRIVRLLRPEDRFDLVELNEVFAGILQRRFQEDRRYQRVAGQCRVHNCPLEEFHSDEPYDYIVSGLPLNNFPAELVRQILESCLDRLAPEGVLSYFEYMYVRPLRRAFCRGEERARLTALDEIIGSCLSQHRIRRDWVFANLPPAWVQHLRPQCSPVAP